MLGVEGERMLVALLGLVSLSVLVQIFSVEYLDLQDDRLIKGIRIHSVRKNEFRKELEEEIAHDNGGVMEMIDENENRHDTQKSRVLEDVELRDLEVILRTANTEITEDERAKIPPITDVIDMYGSHPVILGLERCEVFRRNVKAKDAYLGPAGMFNTGTNLLTNLLIQNCHISEKMEALGNKSIGMRGQVPWGKHSPASWRLKHVASDQKTVNQTNFLPATIIKDPYTWMDSMCRHTYSANWGHDEEHCPNLVPITALDLAYAKGKPTIPVNVHYSDNNITHHESLVGLWNDWYSEWTDVSFPRLVIRFEDLLFHAEEVVGKVCKCVGGVMHTGKNFKYIEKSAKKGKAHEGSNGLIKSLVSYGNKTRRVMAYKEPDLDYARKNLKTDLMEMFHYNIPVLP